MSKVHPALVGKVCEVCGKQAVGFNRDIIELEPVMGTDGVLERDIKAGARHWLCKRHMPKLSFRSWWFFYVDVPLTKLWEKVSGHIKRSVKP